ncbi:M73 family metallopeptidase [bacterium]|nr:M73 family metallopeptidase [bacterium]
MKKIIFSLAMIAAVGAIVVGATTAFFSDTETSVGNTFTAGTIDISVDGENPWTTNWENYLDKPCQTNYMNFVIKNEGENPAKIWKRLTNVINGPGAVNYCEASSEPEYEDGGGIVHYEGDNLVCDGGYTERDTLSAFMIYDMAICVLEENESIEDCGLVNDGYENIVKPDLTTGRWVVLIDEIDQVRVDNVVDTWIQLSEGLLPNEKLAVSQSYHLMTWDVSGQPIITNWAQGDTMAFDVELDARQLTAPAPGTTMSNGDVTATVQFVQKNPVTWVEIAAPQGSLTYNIEGEEFVYDIDVTGLAVGVEYSLIYYADPYPGNNPGALIATYTVDGAGEINDSNNNVELGLDLPDSADANYPVGAKLWLVLAADYSGSQMVGWNPSSYLFDKGLVNYDDTQI